ncbi:killer toxin-resistance protein 5 [[Candida] railenensis]|uniref:Killer toxin-resistance protein 5 n=1 Tax=[Candida] railenensis TaxID=45579 RepID=A0A9P0QR37_9ASCO|nr:killer toxin-resistance protein 5 [[Candida] railenensis]
MLLVHFTAYVAAVVVSTWASTIDVGLEASWKSTSFQLNLLESAAQLNEELYFSTIEYITGINEDEDADDFDEDQKVSDKMLFDHVKLKLDSSSLAFLNFSTIYKVNSPRIQAHYDYFSSNPELLERVKSECSTDSFGNRILTESSPNPEAFLLLNNKIYCSPDEVFALQTDSVKQDSIELLPFDRIYGANSDSPLSVLYGDIESEFFRKLLKNMLLSAKSGKLRFIWRYISSKDEADRPFETLAGYGIDLSLKRTDYIAIDDRDGTEPTGEAEKIHLTKEQSSQLGESLTRKLLQNPSYTILREYLENFPSRISEIAYLSVDNDEVKTNILANEKIGLSSDSIGLYVNGAPIHRLELDSFSLVKKIKVELDIINQLMSLGFSIKQSKLLVSKFSLLSAVKQAQYYQGNTMMGNNENRYKLYQHKFESSSNFGSGGVVYFNDIEEDDAYSDYPVDRIEAYSGETFRKLKQGQIPPLKENIHELIFAIDILDKEHLKIFFSLSKLILDRSLPQQLAILPLSLSASQSSLERDLIESFYFVTSSGSPKEGLAFLYKYLESKSDEETNELISEIKEKIPESFEFKPVHKTTQDVFSIDQASVIINGVITSLSSPNWQNFIGKQIVQDVTIIQKQLKLNNKISSLKSLLYDQAGTKRNSRIVPSDLSTLKYKLITEELLKESILIKRKDLNAYRQVKPFWLIGNFNKSKLQKQLITFLKLIKKDRNVQLRIINVSNEDIFSGLDLSQLAESEIDDVISKIESFSKSSLSDEVNIDKSKLLADNKFPSSLSFVLYNSRFLRLDELLDEDELLQVMKFESVQRIGIIEELPLSYSSVFDGKTLIDIFKASNTKFSISDWFDLVTSIITKSFFVDETLYLNDVSRYDFNMLNQGNSLVVSKNTNLDPKVEILLIIDPIDEFAQLAVSLLNSVLDFEFINIKILLQPNLIARDDESRININRIFSGVYPSSVVTFEDNGRVKSFEKSPVTIPKETLLTSELIVPSNWITVIKSEPIGVDLDNIKLATDEKNITAKYELKNLLIEGFAKETITANSPTGMWLEINKSTGKDSWSNKDTTVMSTLGYFQLQGTPGLWNLRIKPESSSAEYYSLLSASLNAFDYNSKPVTSVSTPIFSLRGSDIRVRVTKNAGYEDKALLDAPDSNKNDKLKKKKKSGFFSSSNKDEVEKVADINIFSIVSGHLYERFLSIMTASVRAHTDQTVKFWIIENYISSNFKSLLPYLSHKYGFEYELITYKWPKWLRQQREKQRTIWGYKILFLDVIFPQELDKVIFVDADQIVRTDMKELVDEDLDGKVYGFTPMCESREEMEGFRFWKQGYWKKVLGDQLKYHISALFVVDLKEFKKSQAGNKLRSHYQKLSSDSSSLANLDQDLPNNLQRMIPIHSLSQDWLWCETWCADEGIKRAKTIDLCNNPLTKEPKLERAKRQIPEWVKYDDEVSALVEKMREDMKEQELKEKLEQEERKRKEDERRDQASDDTDANNEIDNLFSYEDDDDGYYDEL